MENLFNEESQGAGKKNAEAEIRKALNVQIEYLTKENERLRKENVELINQQGELEKLKPDKTFGLNVCGDVMLNKMEVEIVDTMFFQRLSFVNQLGSTNKAYPSANHTRFEHSLGVLKMADLMIQKIRSNKHSTPDERKITLEEEQIIRLLALLHDIGHMPFGHTIEDEFNIFQSHDKHESRWQHFLGEKSDIGEIIIRYRGKEFHKRFFRLIKCEKNFKTFENDAFMYDIVSNTVCADLLDYLQRDCQYTNLKLNFHPRFLDYLVIKDVESEETKKIEKRIVIRLCKTRDKEPRKDIQSELVQLIRNRFYLGERVYYHHAKIKTGALVAGAVARAKQAGSFKILNEYTGLNFDEGDGPLYDLHTWGDLEMLVNLKNLSADGKQGKNPDLINGAKFLANAFFNRIIYYQFHSYSKKDLKLDQSVIDEIINKKIKKDNSEIFEAKVANDFGDPLLRLNLEERICEYLPDMKSGDFLIYFPNYKMQMKLAEVKVEEKDGSVNSLRFCRSEIIKNECEEIIKKHQDIWRLRVFIHPRFIEPLGINEAEKKKEEEKYLQQFHQEYKKEYKMYLHIIEKYCNAIFANNEEQKNFYEDFWRELFEFFVDNELDGSEETTDLYNPVRDKSSKTGRKNKSAIISDMAVEFADNTYAKRSKAEILEHLEDTFKANLRK